MPGVPMSGISRVDPRRGQPTVHRKFEVPTPTLAGDGLLTLAFEVLGDAKTHAYAEVRSDLVLALDQAAGNNGMVDGPSRWPEWVAR